MIQWLQTIFVYIIMHLSVVFFLYPEFIYLVTERGHWIVIIIQCLLELLFIWIYSKGLQSFTNKDIVDIYLTKGKWIAFIILAPFITDLIFAVALHIRIHSEIIINVFLNRTPYWPIIMLFFLISTYTAIKGLQTILRSAVFIFITFVPLIIFVTISSFPNFDFHNANPIWNPSFDYLFNPYFLHGFSAFSGFLFLGLTSAKLRIKFHVIFLAWLFVTLFFLIII